jgi:hypothetical protein
MRDSDNVVAGTVGVLRKNQRKLAVTRDQTYLFHRIGLQPEASIAEERSVFG